METFIVAAGLITSAIGTLLLLLSLANKRVQLVKAYNIQQEIAKREQEIEENKANFNKRNATADGEVEVLGGEGG